MYKNRAWRAPVSTIAILSPDLPLMNSEVSDSVHCAFHKIENSECRVGRLPAPDIHFECCRNTKRASWISPASREQLCFETCFSLNHVQAKLFGSFTRKATRAGRSSTKKRE
jgi:hypothetical protein